MQKTLSPFISVFTVFIMLLMNYHTTSAAPAHAPKTYYVNPSGNDTNSGSSASPFKTLSKAASVLMAGDTLMVSGTFTNQNLYISTSGTSSAPISIVGQNAFINANGTQNNGIRVTGNYVNVSGFDVRGSLEHGILLGGKNVTFENSSVHDGVLDNGSNGICGTGNWASGIKVTLGGENIVIRGNTVFNNCGEGIAITRGINVLVENNTVHDNFAVNIYVDNSPYVTVQNNSITCSDSHLRDGKRAKGIALGEEQYSGWGAQLHHINVLNNYIEECSDGITTWKSEISNSKLRDTVISGNIIPSATRRGLTILSLNSNVRIENNTTIGDIYIQYPTGVTLFNNNTYETTFVDVPTTHSAYTYIEQVYASGITAGCSTSPSLYCPDSPVTRSEMAVFLLRGMYGESYSPPSASGNMFFDVSASYWAVAWIEAFAQLGISAGCSGGNYCPSGIVTRAQMAIFLLRAKYGSSYSPPTATGTMFTDVPANAFAATWIEQLAIEGISGGCGGTNFCPNAPVTRAQMAIFLVKTFNLP